MGTKYFRLRQFALAVSCFRSSFKLRPCHQAAINLASALLKSRRYDDASKVYLKCLTKEFNLTAAVGLADTLIYLKHFDDSIYWYKQALCRITKGKSYNDICKKLASSYAHIGNNSLSLRYWHKYYNLQNPIVDISTASRPLIDKDQSLKFSHSESQALRSTFSSSGFSFIPSFTNIPNHVSSIYRYLIYLHVPKCGGTSFHVPLDHVRSQYLNLPHVSQYISSSQSHFKIGNIEDVPLSINQISCLSQLIENSNGSLPPSFFWTIHGKLHDETFLALKTALGYTPLMISTLRDPVKRLKSHLRYHCPKFTSVDELLSYIVDDSLSLSNPFSRLLDKHGLKDSLHHFFADLNFSPTPSDNVINFLDLHQSAALDMLKTLHLSSCGFPNLLQASHLNVSKRSTNSNYDKWVDQAFSRCIELGYLDKDSNHACFTQSDDSFKNSMSRDYSLVSHNPLHPLTVVVTSETHAYTVFTKEILVDPQRVLCSLRP